MKIIFKQKVQEIVVSIPKEATDEDDLIERDQAK